jgi:CheY-like chemotaxis protein
MDHAEPPDNGHERASAGVRELCSTLLNISGFAALIRNHPTDPARILRYCDAIEKAALRATTLLDQLALQDGGAGTADPSCQEAGGSRIPPRRGSAVLLVDDEPAILAVERDLLELQGYAVLTASDGMEGVEVFREHREEISLVVLDLVMPRMDGGQAYLAMKQLDPDLQAFFCTAHASDDLMKSLLQEGSLRALRKPFDASEFLKMVADVLPPPPRSGTPRAS